MAPASKKKKKSIANPARGFATTSVASKPKIEKEKTAEVEPEIPLKETSGILSAVALDTPAANADPVERELHELSPEDLERRLEESELQLLVEKHGSKSQREASRYVSKLQTDCRLLRAQAQNVSTRQLLSKRAVDSVLALAAEDTTGTVAPPDEHSSRRVLPEEETTIKLWTVQLALLGLGFHASDVENALKHILRFPPPDVVGTLWGFDECLDWLVLNSAEEELPDYDSQTGKTMILNKPDTESQIPLGLFEASPNLPSSAKVDSKTNSTPESTTPIVPDIDVSDLDSDLEPIELLSIYLSTKARIFEIEPQMNGSGFKDRRRKPMGNPNGQIVPPAIAKLEQKLRRIENDVLFDKHEAEGQWLVKRNQLAQENAQRRRLQIPQPPATPAVSSKANSTQVSRPQSESSSESSSDESENSDDTDDDAFGDLFASTTDNPSESQNRASSGPATTEIGVQIRDLGQYKGISPRRVLEEACRARDSGCRFQYKTISSSAFSNRHHLLIIWSKDQDIEIALPLRSIQCVTDLRHASFKMETVATPDRQQSESFICTVALFQVFSSSTREEKVYLRLPPAYRDLWLEFSEQRNREAEQADMETIRKLRDLVRVQKSQEDDEDVVLTRNFKRRVIERGADGYSTPLNEDRISEPSVEQDMKSIWAHKSSASSYQRMLPIRASLPMFSFRDAVLAAIDNNQITIICGETGCGKSTQTPAYILQHELSQGRPCKIYCTEPRRISAITLAQRVSEELGEHKNDVGTARSLVGYAIRLESKTSASTRLVYATTGIVLRMLESPDGFNEVTHIVIDEVHERSIETDFLLIILRSLISKRPELKVILMSATVDSQRFSNYFYQAPVLNVPGRTFPVTTRYLEDAIELTGHVVDENDNSKYDNDDDEMDEEATIRIPGTSREASFQGYSSKTRATLSKYDEYRIDYALIVKLIENITTNPDYQQFARAILVFLPGIAEIKRVYDMLGGTRVSQHYVIHALHSTVSSEDQQAAFTIPPHGFGKIVLSTNIAETGVTIPDITCVIDTGKHKEMRFDERRQISRLVESFISRANAKQRRGRAGRVQEGLSFHLFTKNRHDESMADQQTPEMLRLSLQDLIMRVKICKLGDIQSTLAEALDPPSAKNIRRAIDALIDVGALSTTEELTSLGHQLAKLPLDPYLGKLVLFGTNFGCLDVSLTLAAILTSKSPFVSAVGMRSQADLARAAFKLGDSDLLTEYNAYMAWRRVCTSGNTSEYQFCRKNSLSSVTLANIEDLKSQLLSSISDAGFITLAHSDRSALSRIHNTVTRHRRFVPVPAALDTHTSNLELVSAVVAWSFYPKLLAREGKGWRSVATNQTVSIHPTSVIRNASLGNTKFLSFYSILQSGSAKNYNANSLTPVHPLPLIFLAGDAAFHPTAHVIQIDNGTRLRFSLVDGGWKTFTALKFLRKRMEEILERRWKKPEAELPLRLARWVTLWEEIVTMWERGESARAE